ncbi:hypothetical protein PXH69_24470 [Rhodococcus qingshengii]|uniref:Uncharacterized protein n=1 Tax=Rhodococcus qingshengii TaxID=334542 RepID=A0AAW6LS94_RHOSG|nr:hypothetical protein [Rhodococcus qingshengii]MDE8648126.1 hypothetical protein [Rhodococcus qingshengii]
MATEKYPYDPETGSMYDTERWNAKWKANEPFFAELRIVSYSTWTRFVFEDVETGARYGMSAGDMFDTASRLEFKDGKVSGMWEAVIRGGSKYGLRPVIAKRR